MAGRFRRRRNRGSWLALDPSVFVSEQQPVTYFQTQTNPVVVVGEHQGVVQTPILYDITRQPDAPSQDDSAGPTMRDFVEGSELYIDRIVGKVWCDYENLDANNLVTNLLVCMALAVLPVEDTGAGSGQASFAGDPDDINPLIARNTMMPYIWRRTWMLYGATAGSFFVSERPVCIADYGSVMDGGHVDAKTRRRIRKNERLFHLFTSATLAVLGSPVSDNVVIDYGYDFRVHGAMRRGGKNRF